jgi:hypothetical protein
MMRRVLEASEFNKIAAHPDVKPWIGGDPDAEVDLTNLVANPANYCFLTDRGMGGYILVNKGNGLYEAHTLAMPSDRGKAMLNLMRKGFAFMFLATDCTMVTTLVPDGAIHAASWARLAGFRNSFRREAFFRLDGRFVGGTFMNLSYEDWVAKAPGLVEQGQAFHGMMDRVRLEGSHADDDIHDRWVGATIAAIKAGNLIKAIGLYNRWATIAGYVQSHILSVNPPLVDIGDAVIQLIDGRMDVLKVRDLPFS